MWRKNNEYPRQQILGISYVLPWFFANSQIGRNYINFYYKLADTAAISARNPKALFLSELRVIGHGVSQPDFEEGSTRGELEGAPWPFRASVFHFFLFDSFYFRCYGCCPSQTCSSAFSLRAEALQRTSRRWNFSEAEEVSRAFAFPLLPEASNLSDFHFSLFNSVFCIVDFAVVLC